MNRTEADKKELAAPQAPRGVLELHGIADAEKAMMFGSKRQHVTVIDGDGRVLISLSDPPTAGLTPNQARMIGKQLIAAAMRVEGYGAR